jgi:phospholipid/cholesterol/gamma-HCH transport system substrate-binding protein
MDLHYQKEVTVGTFVLAGIGLFVLGTMWLKGTTFRSTGRTALIRFEDIQTLKVDNEVTVSGYPVGKVKEIEFKEPGKVMVEISLPPDMPLRTGATATISSGIFSSDARLILNPGAPEAPRLPEGTIVEGSIEAGLFAKGAKLADRADSVMIGLQAIANQNTADELTRTLKSLQRVLGTLNERLPRTTSEADKTMGALRRLSERLDSTIATLPVGNAIERADTLARNLSTMSIQLTATGARLDTLVQRINAGQGSLGKFASDTGFYVDSRATMQAVKELVDELTKHPGKLQIQVKLF